MTSNLDIVKAWVDNDDFEESMEYLADEFQNLDGEGNLVMDRAGYYGMGLMLHACFDDFVFKRTALREEGEFVIMTGHFEGTHTADLDMSAMGGGVIPASGKKIVWDEVGVKITVADGKLLKEEPYGESGGMAAFLAPLLAAQASS